MDETENILFKTQVVKIYLSFSLSGSSTAALFHFSYLVYCMRAAPSQLLRNIECVCDYTWILDEPYTPLPIQTLRYLAQRQNTSHAVSK